MNKIWQEKKSRGIKKKSILVKAWNCSLFFWLLSLLFTPMALNRLDNWSLLVFNWFSNSKLSFCFCKNSDRVDWWSIPLLLSFGKHPKMGNLLAKSFSTHLNALLNWPVDKLKFYCCNMPNAKKNLSKLSLKVFLSRSSNAWPF